MKQVFRRGKPPLRLMEKGDMTPRKPKHRKLVYITPDGSKLKRLEDMTTVEKEAYRKKSIEKALTQVKINSFQHGQPVTIKVGEHAGETAVVIGPSKTIPGRIGVLTLGGLVHYKIEDLEVQK